MAQPSPQAIAAAQQAATRQQQEKLQLQGLASTLQRQQQMQPPSGDVMSQGVAAAQRGFESDRGTGGGRAIAVRNKGGYSLYGQNTPEARRLMQAGQRLRGTPNRQGQSQSQQPQAVPDPTLQRQTPQPAIAAGGQLSEQDRLQALGLGRTEEGGLRVTQPRHAQTQVTPDVASRLRIMQTVQDRLPVNQRATVEAIARDPNVTTNQFLTDMRQRMRSAQSEGGDNEAQSRVNIYRQVQDRIDPADRPLIEALANDPDITTNQFINFIQEGVGIAPMPAPQSAAAQPAQQTGDMMETLFGSGAMSQAVQAGTQYMFGGGREQQTQPQTAGQLDEDTIESLYREAGWDGQSVPSQSIRNQANKLARERGLIGQ